MMQRPRPYELTTHDDNRVDWLTKAALMKAERILGYKLTITQGSYNGGTGEVEQSGNTHDRGGVVDGSAWDGPAKIRALRLSGFIAYLRPEIVNLWPRHWHAVLECNDRLAPSAQRQVFAYHRGLDGLSGGGPDPHPGLVFRGFSWPYGGIVGLARWHRDQLRGKERTRYLEQLRKVVRGR